MNNTFFLTKKHVILANFSAPNTPITQNKPYCKIRQNNVLLVQTEQALVFSPAFNNPLCQVPSGNKMAGLVGPNHVGSYHPTKINPLRTILMDGKQGRELASPMSLQVPDLTHMSLQVTWGLLSEP